jgi:hypothetical protein
VIREVRQRVECLDMRPLDEYQALVRADAQEAAERSLQNKFGRLSNRRILSVLRPAAERVDELRGLPDRELLDDWFTEFTRLREMKEAPTRGAG